jgi:hypothetical protein
MDNTSLLNMYAFSMPPADAQRMYDEELPDEITIVCAVIPDTSEHEVCGFLTPETANLAQIFNLTEADPKRFGIDSKMSIRFAIGGVCNPLVPFTDAQKEWYHEELCPQLGFFDSTKLNDEILGRGDSLLNDMILYDAGVALSGSTEPKDHDPILAEAEVVSIMSATTGQLYVSRTAIWNRKLLGFRTALMVMMRATLMGRDPAQEYQRFIAAGGKYFLDYPPLFP